MFCSESETHEIVERYLREKGLPVDMAITFPDVVIIDRKSRVGSRSEITDLSSMLAGTIRLNIPVVSANMADITESEMAIALARAGGCGFIHQFAPLDFRVEEIKNVKRADNEVVENPWMIDENEPIAVALSFMKEKNTSGLLVIDGNGKLVGILTERDVRFLQFHPEIYGKELTDSLLVKNLMTKDPLTAPRGIQMLDAVRLLQTKKVEKLPLTDGEGRPVGLITSKDILKKSEYSHASRDVKGRLIVGGTVGVAKDVVLETKALLDAGADLILVDTARGNSELAGNTIRTIRSAFPHMPLVAGNVDNPEGALTLIHAGADTVKVGIGPGSACKTREETGIGVPQLTAIAECAAVCKHHNRSAMADGGMSQGNHIAKAIVAGADTVMLGGAFAATEETPGEVYYDGDEQFKVFKGSASLDAQVSRVHAGDLDKIRAPEGGTRKVPYKGKKATSVLHQLMGDLRSSMSYVNAMTIPEFQNARFRRQSRAGYEEGKPKK